MNEALQNEFIGMLNEKTDENNTYDFVVLFSGGKDSSYIAHMAKKWGKTCLLSICNGFEDKSFSSQISTVANQLGLDLFTYQSKVDYISFYRDIITNPKNLEIDSNPLCILCAWHKMAIGIDFAEKMKIPFVFYGGSPEQVASQNLTSFRDIKFFDEVLNENFKTKCYNLIKTFEGYNKNEEIKAIYDKIFYKSKISKLIHPFMYLPYNIEEIKRTLEKEYNWQNPVVEYVSNEKYITSGCSLFSLCQLLEQLIPGYRTHETDQMKKDFSKGILSEESYDLYAKHLQCDFDDLLLRNENNILKLGLKEWISSLTPVRNQN